MKTDPAPLHYIKLEVGCPAEYTDILIAELAEAGFGMFMETESGFEADAEEGTVDEALMESIRSKYAHLTPFDFHISSVKKENWNELWEKNLTPVVVEDQLIVRAEFHRPEKTYPYEIIITPKMSFGTGHHPTTYLMLKAQLKIVHTGKRVMDAGCGTAILSIMASKRRASLVEAFDIDEWSMSNGEENVKLNGCANIHIRRGTINSFNWPEQFDIILANINRNILLAELSSYAACLKPGGILQLSGFYEKDVRDLVEASSGVGLEYASQDTREQWATLQLRKSN